MCISYLIQVKSDTKQHKSEWTYNMTFNFLWWNPPNNLHKDLLIRYRTHRPLISCPVCGLTSRRIVIQSVEYCIQDKISGYARMCLPKHCQSSLKLNTHHSKRFWASQRYVMLSLSSDTWQCPQADHSFNHIFLGQSRF